MISKRSGASKLALAALAGLGLWAILAFVVGPALIRQGYAGESVGWINGAFGGRSIHPVERYLSAWRSLMMVALAGLVVLTTAAAVYLRFRSTISGLVDRVLSGPESISTGEWIRLAVLAGLLGGTLQAAWMAARQTITTQPGTLYHSETWWMAPLSAALACLMLGIGVAILARLGSGRIGLSKAAFVLGFLVAFGVIQSEGLALHKVAEIMLALGIATAIARTLVARASGVRRALGRSTPVLAGLVALLVFVGWRDLPRVQERSAVSNLETPRAGLPNLLIVILDTVRAKQLGLYGYPRATSDAMDAWAASGVTYDWAFSASSWTLPGHATLFTGLPNAVLKTGPAHPLEDRFRTLAEVLSELGYATGGFVANQAYTTETSGLDQGFQRYEDRPYDPAAFLRSSWISSRLIAAPIVRATPFSLPRFWSKTAEDVRVQFTDWLRTDRDPDRPFFAFLNIFDAHGPYDSPGAWPSTFGPPGEGSWYDFFDDYWVEGEEPRHADLQPWINSYDGAIAYIDSELAQLRETLEQEGLADNTVVVITSDHGEMWGERNELGHAGSLYSPGVHVPLFIVAPGRLPTGEHVRTPVSLVDLAPTLGDILDLEALRQMPGQSFAAAPADTLGQVAAASPVMALEPQGSAARWWAPSQRGSIRSIVDGSLQFIVHGDGVEELYDLEADPDVTRDLSSDAAWEPALARLRAALRTRLDQDVPGPPP